MKKENEIKIFEDRKVRSLWDSEQEKWYISIVDVIAILTESPNPRKYWSVLKTRLKAEGSQLATNCSQLKMQSVEFFQSFQSQINFVILYQLWKS
ncbi:MAG TPA: hypothetical protein VKT28_07145 [Puia sp.]|nr:hypothetical protein [Puia sp.]